MNRRKTKLTRKSMIIVGPDPSGYGGISRVVTIWTQNNFFVNTKSYYIKTVSENKNKLLTLINALLSFLCLLREGEHCVYIHTASFNSFYRKSIFILLSLIFKKKIILHIHPSYFTKFLSNLSKIKKIFCFWLLKNISGFVVLTEEMKKQFQTIVHHKKIFILRNPVDMKELYPKIEVKREKNRILFLGWYVKEKGVYDLVDACSILTKKGKNIKIDFYGTKGIENLRSYVAEKGLSNKIKVNGWADSQTKIRALHKCTMLVLPSHTEGIPNVILEAMATQTPIVSTLVGGLKEILRDKQNALIVNVSDANDLSKKILQLIEDRKLRDKIAFGAFEDCRKNYEVGIIKKKFNRIIDDLCL